MKKQTGIFVFSLVLAMLALTGSVHAQQSDPYSAGWDAAWMAGDSDLYQSPLDAYEKLGYSIYGPIFREAFVNSGAYSAGQVGAENTSAGAFETFATWYDAQLDAQETFVTKQTVVKGGAKRVTRNFRSLSRASRLRNAGDLIQQVSLSVDYSFASVEDNIIGGKGHDSEASLFLSGNLGEKVTFGLGYAQDRYEITSNGRGFEQHTGAIDLMLSLNLTDRFSIGTFVNCSFIDIEDEALDNGILIRGDNYERWGIGLLATYNLDLNDRTNLGLTGSIASMNKRSLERTLDDEDTAFVFLVDLNRQIGDNFDITVYGTYYGLLDRETTPEDPNDNVPDGSYWTWGADLSYKPCKYARLSVGYETTASDNDYEEDRLNLSLVMEF